MCLDHTRTLHTDSPCPQWYLQATITILWLSSWSEQVYWRLREFWKRCKTLIKKIINVTKKNISRPTTKAVSHQLLVNQLTDGQQVFLGAVLHSYQKSAKWYHLPPLTLLSHSDLESLCTWICISQCFIILMVQHVSWWMIWLENKHVSYFFLVMWYTKCNHP